MAAKKAKISPVGDVVFFLVLIFTAALAYSLLKSFADLLPRLSASSGAGFLVSFLVGASFARMAIQGHLSVFIHEFKHAIVSLLAGNSPKSINIKRNSGYYEYEYTQDTESYNAFISLAPYYLPLFTAVLLVAGIYPFWGNDEALKILVGIGYGVDMVLNLRDISPRQSDFSSLRGGFGLGILYVASIHVILLLSIVCWVTGGLELLARLFQETFRLFMNR